MPKPQAWLYLGLSLSGMVVLAWMSYMVGLERAGFPTRPELACTQGRILGIGQVEYGAEIRVEGLDAPLHYSRKSGEFDEVLRALGTAASSSLTLCHRARHTAEAGRMSEPELFEIRSGARSIRTLEQVRDAWREDAAFVWWLAPCIIVGSLFLAYQAGRAGSREDAGAS